MTAEPSIAERAILVRLTPEQYVEKVAKRHLSRRNFLVLQAIARRAHWQSWRWGEGSIRCVENIAGDIAYCERSVQYAYKELVATGWLAIDPRPGRTNHFTVLRPVQPLGLVVDDEPESVENVGDNRPPEDPATPATVAPGGAKVAPDLETPTPELPPEAPHRAWGESVGAAAPAQAAPQWRREGSQAPSGTGPPSPAGAGAKPHRRDAERQRVPEPAPPSPDDVLPGVSEAQAARDGTAGVMPTGEHWSRDAARKLRRCPTCGAVPGAPCRGRGGKLRTSNHRDRRIPH